MADTEIPDVKAIDTSDERAVLDLLDDKDESDDSADSDDTTDKDDTDNDDEDTDNTDTDGSDSNEEDADGLHDENKDEELEENDTLYKQIKKLNPKILKEIPELRSVIFREQQYTELFPTLDDAKDAKEIVGTFEEFERDLVAGKSSGILEALEKQDKNSLKDFVANFIPSVEKQSNDLYLGMLAPEFKKMLRSAVKSADANLRASAQHMHNFIFGDLEFDADAGLAVKKATAEDDNLTKREQEFNERILNSFSSDVAITAKTRALKIISSPLAESGLSELLKKSLTNEIFSRVDSAVIADKRHMGTVNNLWQQAKRAGFTSDWKDRITNAYLTRAKLLIPAIRKQVLDEAKLSGIKQVTSNKKQTTRIVPSGTSDSGKNLRGNVKAGQIDWSKTTERDVLDGKVTYKK